MRNGVLEPHDLIQIGLGTPASAFAAHIARQPPLRANDQQPPLVQPDQETGSSTPAPTRSRPPLPVAAITISPTTAPLQSRLDAAGGSIRPRDEDFMVLAQVGDTCAILLARVAAGGAYQRNWFAKLPSLNDFVALDRTSSALPVVLQTLKGPYTPDVLLSPRSQIAPIIMSWGSVLLLFFRAGFPLKVGNDLSRGWASWNDRAGFSRRLFEMNRRGFSCAECILKSTA